MDMATQLGTAPSPLPVIDISTGDPMMVADPSEALARADAYLNTGLVSAAAELYRDVLEEGEVAEARYGAARCAFLRSELHEALGHLQLLQQADSDRADVANDIGVIYFQLGLSTQAIEQIERAVGLSPEYLVAWRNLVDVSVAMGEHKACRTYCARVLELDPEADVKDLLAQLEA